MRIGMMTAVLLLTGCGDDTPAVGVTGVVVGGACALHQDCAAGSVCLAGGDFPDGTCSVPCNSDGDCPGGTACVDKDGDYCLLACQYSTDCRPGYTCKARDRVGISGQALVCLKD